MALRSRDPWDADRPSLFEHVITHVPTSGAPGLDGAGWRLPDEDDLDGELRWAPGAHDGVVAHHVEAGEVDRTVGRLVDALRGTAGRRRGRARARLYELSRTGQALPIVDPLLALLVERQLPPAVVRPAARWLAFEGRHRDPVKLGIAMLGLGHDGDDRAKLQVLGRHEEFTLYVAVALANTSEDPDRELYELARMVDGWGRVETVRRLRHTEDPEIRDWIFHEGFRNKVMDEYLAHVAATAGGLRERLSGDPGEATLDAACDIVTALIDGGPAEDIDDYGDAVVAVLRLLELLESRAHQLRHLLVAEDIASFLDHDGPWDARAARGWTPSVREEARQACARIVAHPRWDPLIDEGLLSEDHRRFFEAERAARALGRDTFPSHWRRLLADPVRGSWGAVMRGADQDRIAQIIDLAEQELPLDEIATGPGQALGLGSEWVPHRALVSIVQDLGRFPGHGWSLIAAALRSPVVNNRNAAVRALEAWGRASWPDGADLLVVRARDEEPHDEVRQRLARLAAGEPPGDEG